MLSSNKDIYGIYSICISITVFFSYADLGFLSSGNKYATESYIRGENKLEIQYTASSFFIFLISLVLFSVFFTILSLDPSILIKNLESNESKDVAQKLFTILAVTSPLYILVRLPQIILSIRVCQYLYQRNQIIGNLIKIISVFYFFRSGIYDIVGYYLFIQIVSILVGFVSCIEIHRKYKYDFRLFVKSFRFSKSILKNTYLLALSGFIATLTWALYYEMDSPAIGKLLGLEAVATYSIGFTLLTFIRNILGVLYSPFGNRFYHFIGLRDFKGLSSFYKNIVIGTSYITILPLIILFINIEPFILSWVGKGYLDSVLIAEFLLACNLLACIAYPAGMLLYGLEKIKLMNFQNILNCLVFWSGVFITVNFLGVVSFAVFKLITFIFSGIFYIYVSVKYINWDKPNILELTKSIFLPVSITIIIAFLFKNQMVYEKCISGLMLNVTILVIECLLAFIVAYFSNNQFRNLAHRLLKRNDSN